MNVVEYKDVEILRKELVVLKHVDLVLKEGEFVYLIGKVGSGKSSLLKSMYAEIPVMTGDARVMDYDLVGIRRKDIPMLRREIGIVFQDFQLLTDHTGQIIHPFFRASLAGFAALCNGLASLSVKKYKPSSRRLSIEDIPNPLD